MYYVARDFKIGIVAINKLAIEDFGGGFIGIRDKNLIESAIANPKQLYYYQDADIYTIASSYAISIIKNHGFIDGNKRTGFASMNAFLEFNGIKIDFIEDEIVDMMVGIANNEVSLKHLSEYLSERQLCKDSTFQR